jgi:hypothetical protein
MQHQMTTVDVSYEPSTIAFLQVVNEHLELRSSESWELVSATVGKYEEAGWDRAYVLEAAGCKGV